MNLLQNGSGTWFSQHGTPNPDHLWWHCVSQQLGHYPILPLAQQLTGTCAQSVEDGVMCIQCKGEIIGRLLHCVTDGASSNSERYEREVQQEWRNRLDKRQQQKAIIRFQTINQWKWLVDCYSSCAHRWRHKRAPVAHSVGGWTIWFSRTKDVVLDGVRMFQRQNPGMLLVITQHVLVLV